MAGRYTGWHHKKGAAQASPAELAASRLVLGQLQDQLSLGGLQSGLRRVVLADGTVIEAQVAMGQPTVRIQPVRAARRVIPARELGEIITVPRSAAALDGVSEAHPEVMLRHADGFWRAYFYGQAPAGVANPGVYSDMFPLGLGQGGTTDWVGPDGERLSWYGPSSRAFPDAYVHARWQLGKQVFYLGRVLLDTDDYLERSAEDSGFDDRYIVGAALKRIGAELWLYTVQVTGDDGDTPPAPVGDENLGGFFSYPLAAQSAGGLHRYRLYRWTDDAGVERWAAAANSREALLTISTGSPDPWFFNKDCTEAVCHPALPPPSGLIPGKPWWAAIVPHGTEPPDSNDVGPSDLYHPPATQAVRFRVFIGDDSVTPEGIAYSLVSGGAAVPVTADYDMATGSLFGYGIRLASDLVPYFVFDGTEAPLYASVHQAGAGTGSGDLITGIKRFILYANPRDHVVVLLRLNIQFDTGAAQQLVYMRHTVEVYVDGTLAEQMQVTDTGDALSGLVQSWSDSQAYLDDLAGRNITPHFFIHGLLQVLQNTAPTGSKTWASRPLYIGANPMYAQLPYPADCWFGYADGNVPPGQPAQPISEFVGAGFNGSVPDDRGHFAVTGAARHDAAVVVSTWVPRAGMNDSFTWVADASLEALTGIGGAQARYHPIRMLGKMVARPRTVES